MSGPGTGYDRNAARQVHGDRSGAAGWPPPSWAAACSGRSAPPTVGRPGAAPGPLRIHGNPVATRDKDMKLFKDQAKVDLQIQLSVTHTETVTRIYSGATKQFDLFTLQHPFIKKLARTA